MPALAEDIERWMAEEPVTAWREPVSRRARRWARRNRSLVTGAAMAVLAGVVGLAAVLAVQTRSNRALKVANEKTSRALEAETKAKADVQEALAQSEEARKRSEAVLGFLKNDVLASARPEGQEGGLGVEVTVRKAVDAAEPKIAGAFQDQPIVEADVRDTLGTTYLYWVMPRWRSGSTSAPWSCAKQGSAPTTPTRSPAATTSPWPTRPPAASTTRSRCTRRRSSNGSRSSAPTTPTRSPAATTSPWPIAPPAAPTRRSSCTRRPSSNRSRSSAPTTPTRSPAATTSPSPTWPPAAPTDAIKLLEATLKQRESKLGPDHPDTLTSRNNLASAYCAAGRTIEAITLHEANLKQRESKLGPDHPDTLTSRNNLAAAYKAAGRTDEAIKLHEATLKQLESKLGPDHPDTLTSRNNLAGAYLAAGRTDARPSSCTRRPSSKWSRSSGQFTPLRFGL